MWNTNDRGISTMSGTGGCFIPDSFESDSDYLVFKFGNARLIIMGNFEALGRYITAREQAEKFARERNNALRKLSGMVQSADGSASSNLIAYDFDVAKAQELLNQAAELNQNLHVAVAEANKHAEACGKPKLEIYQSRY